MTVSPAARLCAPSRYELRSSYLQDHAATIEISRDSSL